MSTKVARDKEGFLKCEYCWRRFQTETGFKIHSYNQHKKEADTQPNEHQQPQTKKAFSIKSNLQYHINIVHKKLTPFQCQECKKHFGHRGNLQRHKHCSQKS